MSTASNHETVNAGRNAGMYRGRLAPSPTGYLHLGHAQTFWMAQERARQHAGTLILRNDDLDRSRVRAEYVEAMLVDLAWFGLKWSEGPDCGGPFGPYSQSERLKLYRSAFEALRQGGHVYPCTCSRRDIMQALTAPHELDDEPIYPGTCRPSLTAAADAEANDAAHLGLTRTPERRVNWRFRVRDGEKITFHDGHYGLQECVAGRSFGDFIIWRHDELPSYQLAVVVDDHAMKVTEVVRGADLLRSTARQLLIYRALGLTPPQFWHCPLVTDGQGMRLAKRHEALSLRTLRGQGRTPEALRSEMRSH